MKATTKLTVLILILFFVSNEIKPQIDTTYFNGIEYRGIGPYRGGRSCAVTGIPSNANLYYFGATGGGVWKSENSGTTWKNISDRFFGG